MTVPYRPNGLARVRGAMGRAGDPRADAPGLNPMAPAGRAKAKALRAYGLEPATAAHRERAAEAARSSWPMPAGPLAEQLRHVLASVLSGCPRLELKLPGPPVPKERARTFFDPRKGCVRSETPKKTEDYEAHARRVAGLLAVKAGWPKRGYPGARYVVDADFVLAEDRGDFDNLLKTVDALKGVAWADDAGVCVGVTTRRVAAPGERPGARLTIWALLPAENKSP